MTNKELILKKCGFESRWGHGLLSFVGVIYYQLEVFAKGPSVVQRNSTRCGVSECDLETSTVDRSGPNGGVSSHKKEIIEKLIILHLCICVWRLAQSDVRILHAASLFN